MATTGLRDDSLIIVGIRPPIMTLYKLGVISLEKVSGGMKIPAEMKKMKVNRIIEEEAILGQYMANSFFMINNHCLFL